MRIQIQIRYVVFVPYLIFIGMMGGNVLVDAIVIGLALGVFDLIFDDHGDDGGRPA